MLIFELIPINRHKRKATSLVQNGLPVVKATLRSIYCGLSSYLDESVRQFVYVYKQGMN